MSARTSWRLFGAGVVLMLGWLAWQVGALVAEVVK